jgi:hypothetical protein
MIPMESNPTSQATVVWIFLEDLNLVIYFKKIKDALNFFLPRKLSLIAPIKENKYEEHQGKITAHIRHVEASLGP